MNKHTNPAHLSTHSGKDTLPSVWASVVQNFPDRVALSTSQVDWNYRFLDKWSDSLTILLREKGLQPGQAVAISLDRSPELIGVMLAVLKAGAYYVPVDPAYPQARKAYMVQDSGALFLIQQSKEIANDWLPGNCVALPLPSFEVTLDRPDNTLPGPDQLAYSVYTSGSTGQPKGVIVPHKNVVTLVKAAQDYFPTPQRFLFNWSPAFDGSVMIIWWTLCSGGTLVIAPPQLEKNPDQLSTFIRESNITHILTFPSLYALFLDQSESDTSSLQLVLLAGEAFPAALAVRHQQVHPDIPIFNLYGPTESTVWSTVYEVPKQFNSDRVPIGKARPGVETYVLDQGLQPLPPGQPGELVLGGPALALGYFGKPELSAEKFIQNPFGEGKLYRTGDLVVLNPQGELEFIGRLDHQVKLRGYRIELGEIENTLGAHPDVRDAVVVLHGDQPANHKLLAYCTLRQGASIKAYALKEYASEKLPEYFVPSQIVLLDKLPLAASGKIDRQALPVPGRERPDLAVNYQAPSTQLEKWLASEWAELLDLESVGINDRFFDLGGNSLLAARFIARLQGKLNGTNVFIVSIFDHPTIATFAKFLQKEYPEALHEFQEITTTEQSQKIVPISIKELVSMVPQHLQRSQFQNEEKERCAPALFILGPPRSGTSLLRVMLAGHPGLFAANELQLLHFHNMFDRELAYSGKFSLWSEGLVRTIMELQQCDADSAKFIVSEWVKEKKSTAAVYKQLQQWIGEHRILVDKSPSYAMDSLALEKAAWDFSNARFVHLVRHPYAMVESFAKMRMHQAMYLYPNQLNAKQTGEFIWTQSHNNILNFLENIPEHQKFTLIFEDLVKSPEATMKALFQRLELPWHDSVLLPYEGLDQKMTDGIYAESKPMGDINLLKRKSIDASLADAWKGVLNDNYFSQETWTTAATLGYQQPNSQKLSHSNLPPQEEPIAIVGMGVRLPGADSIPAFWEMLVNGIDPTQSFTESDLIAAGLDPALIHTPGYVTKGLHLADYDCFDASFFGYTPAEAALMDPQHRVFLECAVAAIEHAGIVPQTFNGKIGVFGATARNTYLVNNVLTHPNYFKSLDDFQIGIALEKDFPATKLAWQLNLHGPALSVQTACSSSGVALHLACASIRQGDCQAAIVGGGRIQPPVRGGYPHTDGHALSPDGKCRAFDAAAEGMVRGHGMAAVVLKTLSKAQQDGDTIYALIRSSAITNDGNEKIGFTAPSVNGQSQAVIEAWDKAGCSPESAAFIECHGTGTRLGDPIELSALTKAFRKWTNKKQYCAIGSVKTNIGHLDAGAAIAGLIKTALAIYNKTIPGNLHFQKPNPQLDWENSPFYVAASTMPWPENSIRRAGLTSLGLGGTNVHIVLEQAPAPSAAAPATQNGPELITWSAKTEQALSTQALQLARYFTGIEPNELGKAAYTLQTGRIPHVYRAFTIADHPVSTGDLLKNLSPGTWWTQPTPSHEPAGVVFMFPGGGAAYVNMCRGLYEHFPEFKKHIEDCFNILKSVHDLDYKELLYPSLDKQVNTPIEDNLESLALLFTVEYALARWWQSCGITPQAMIGHSMGEYAAACIAGVLSLADALGIVVLRGQLFNTLPKGGMLSLPFSPEEVSTKYLGTELDIAVVNKFDQTVVSGPITAIDALKEVLNKEEIHAPRLHIHVAAHSRYVESVLEPFKNHLATIQFNDPKIPWISNLDGQYIKPETIKNPDYWVNHLRQTVHFARGIRTLLLEGNYIFLETGPGQSLSTAVRQHSSRKPEHQVLASARHPKEVIDDKAFWLKTLGQLWLSGHEPLWHQLHLPANQVKVGLPTYPFAREVHWLSAKQNAPQISDSFSPTSKQTVMMTTPSRNSLILQALKEVLQQMSGYPVDQLTDHGTFLELGFDSLFLTQFTSRLKKEWNVQLSFRQLFEELPTLAALSAWVDKTVPGDDPRWKPAPTELPAPPALPLTPPPSVAESSAVPQIQPSLQWSAPSPVVGNSALEALFYKQLELMQQQIQLLGGAAPAQSPDTTFPVSPAPTTPQPENPEKKTIPGNTLKTESSATSTQTEKGSGHGPWKPLNVKKNDQGLSEQQSKALADLIQRYNAKTAGSKKLTQEQRKYLADPRSISGFTSMWKEMVYQIAAEKSKGSRFWDIDGNEYIDFRSAFGINLFGHTPDFIQDAIREQVEKGIELGVLTPLAQKVGALLHELTGMERITLVNTGSEALSASIRAARTATGKDKIVVFDGDYHGIADELLAKSVKMGGQRVSRPVAPGIPANLVSNVLVLDYHDPNLIQILTEHKEDLAAILVEPIQPLNPHVQPVEILRQLREFCTANDTALVFDEMITGFRVAPRGAQEWYGIDADIVAYGKIISGGLPMAAVAGKAKYLDCFDGGYWEFDQPGSVPEAGVTFFGGTFVRHPLCLATSIAALTQIKKQGAQLYDDLNNKSEKFAHELRALFIRTKAPLVVHATASIISVKAMTDDPLHQLFFYYLRLKGIHWTDKAGLISVAHSEEDLNYTVQVFEECIREMQSAGFFDITVFDPEDPHVIISKNINVENTEKKTVVSSTHPWTAPLTQGQLEIWVEQRLGNDAAAAYNLTSHLEFTGVLNQDLLENAIQQLCDRHEALRTYFDFEKAVLHILPQVEIVLECENYTHLNSADQLMLLHNIAQEEVRREIDLFTPPLWRVRLLKFSDTLHHVLLTWHHGIADGYSIGILLSELAQLYTALVKGTPAALPEPKALHQFNLEMQDHYTSIEYQETEKYWVNQFQDNIPILELPLDFKRPSIKTYPASSENLVIDAAIAKTLKIEAAKSGSSLFIFLFTAFQTFLSRISGQEDFVLGLVAAGQSHGDNEHLVGHAVHLLPVRAQVVENTQFNDHLKYMRNKVLDAFAHQTYTLGSLVRALAINRDPSRAPIISVLFNMDGAVGELNFEGLITRQEPVSRPFETFDSFINLKPVKDSFAIDWIYNTDLLHQSTIRNWLTAFNEFLKQLSKNSTLEVNAYPIADTVTWNQLKEWGTQPKVGDSNVCIHTKFEAQAALTPDAIALSSNGATMTYQELNRQANHFAHLLVNNGIQVGDFIGVYFERSIEMVVALMAVLKAGGIYVPLDPANPVERLKVILEDATPRIIMTQKGLKNNLPPTTARLLIWEELPSANGKPIVTASNVKPGDFAYINYTSGSTGKPKGVLIPHASVIDHHNAILDRIPVGPGDIIYSVASIAFDPSVQDFFLPLFVGAQVEIAPESIKRDAFQLKDALESIQPTMMQATPATWRMLLTAGWKGGYRLNILTGGEALTVNLANKLLPLCAGLYNIYGPTETTIWSTLYKVEQASPTPTGTLPIGTPLANTRLYLLDKNLKPVVQGVAGEICIAGPRVAPQGYHQRPELNSTFFIKDPFGDGNMYRTGDLAKWNADGTLTYLNRADNQVKIRGYRIELGEIESVLSGHPELAEVVVVAKDDTGGHKKLVAYFIPQGEVAPEANALRAWLKSRLPEYMVPATYVALRDFPMTATGKVDRKKLPEPGTQDIANTEHKTFAAPQTDAEKYLCQLWQELLVLDEVSIDDNFFELGGHSLKAVSMMSRIKNDYNRQIPLVSILQQPTIRQFAKLLEGEADTVEEIKSLILLKAEGNKMPLYLVHGAGLHVLMYQMLAQHMDAQQPLYALQARGIYGEAEPFDSIEGMAGHYIEEILQNNPHGPYALAGYSFGGIIALEMAQQLKKAGKEVAFLGMFDTVISPDLKPGNFQQIMRVGKKAVWNIGAMLRDPVGNWDYKKNVVTRRMKYKTGDPSDPSVKVDQYNDLAASKYEIKTYDGDLHLFRAATQRFYIEDNQTLGWKKWITGKVIVHDVPGDHLRMFDPPHGEVLSKVLQQALDESTIHFTFG